MSIDNFITTDIPTLGNFYTRTGPLDPPSRRMKRDGKFNMDHRYATDETPLAARILALGRLPAGFGDYGNGLMVVFAAPLHEGSSVPFPGYDNLEWSDALAGRVTDRWPLERWILRAAVHKRVAKAEQYATGWVPVTGISYRRGVPRPADTADDPAFWGDLSNPASFYNLLANNVYSDRWEINFTAAAGVNGAFWPDAQVLAPLNGNHAYINISPGQVRFNNATDSAFHTLYRVDANLNAEGLDVHYGTHEGDASDTDAASLEQAFMDNAVDPTLYRVIGNFNTAPDGNGVYANVMKTGDATADSPTATFPDFMFGRNQIGGWGRGGSGFQILPWPENHFKIVVDGSPGDIYRPGGTYDLDPEDVVPTFVQPWAAGDHGPPELWFFVPTRALNFQLSDTPADVYSGYTYDVHYDVYRCTYDKGHFAHSAGSPDYWNVVLTDDDAWNAGTAKFPANNPQGYGFTPHWYDEGNKFGTITLTGVRMYSDPLFFGGLEGSAPLVPKIFHVDRNPLSKSQMLLTATSGFYPINSVTGVPRFGDSPPLGVQVYQNRATAMYTTDQIWTGTSANAGNTWQIKRIASPPLADSWNNGGSKAESHLFFGGHGQTGFGGVWSPAWPRFASVVDADGRIIIGMSKMVQYKSATGTRVPFWSGPEDAGVHLGLYFPNGFGSASGAQGGKGEVVYKRTSRT